jgi:hypothetical protein
MKKLIVAFRNFSKASKEKEKEKEKCDMAHFFS